MCTSPPPSTRMDCTSRAKSPSSTRWRSTRVSPPGHRRTVTPVAARRSRRSGGAAAPTATIVRAAVPARTTRASTGVRPVESSTTRYGSRGHGGSSRTVSCGSSRSTVSIPTTIASDSLRSSWARPRAASPVIHCDSPWTSAILPSSVMPAFSVTCGRPWRIATRNARFSLAASSRSTPTVTSIPASRRMSNPRPLTSGFGSSSAATTRRTPAATTAVAHGGVRPKCAHGSRFT